MESKSKTTKLIIFSAAGILGLIILLWINPFSYKGGSSSILDALLSSKLLDR